MSDQISKMKELLKKKKNQQEQKFSNKGHEHDKVSHTSNRAMKSTKRMGRSAKG